MSARRARTGGAASTEPVVQLDLFAEIEAAEAAEAQEREQQQAADDAAAAIAAAGLEVVDTAALAALCRAEAEALEARDRDDRERFGDRLRGHTFADKAARERALAEWLEQQLGGQVPVAREGWPCTRCDAVIGAPCGTRDYGDYGTEQDRPRSFVHVGRGFAIGFTSPGASWISTDAVGPTANPAERCTPTEEGGPGGCHRGRCLSCGWRGPVRPDENAAVEDAHDHTHPEWRDVPVVDPAPHADNPARDKKVKRWAANVETLVTEAMGPDWFARGGPIRTRRGRPASRHVPGRAPGGGYDLSAPPEQQEQEECAG